PHRAEHASDLLTAHAQAGSLLYRFAIDLKHKFFRKTGFFRKIRFFEHMKTSFLPAYKYLFNGESV
ncbi:MAG: hypothetical protein R2941_24980, partial [Desulfobacterales bacterium]